MESKELITLQECCNLLQMSRPTFNKRRKEFALTEIVKGKSILFKKSEILNKIYVADIYVESSVDLVQIRQQFDLNKILIDKYTADLRKIHLLDPYGVISLLCYVVSIAKEGENFFFVTPAKASKTVRYLARVGFFSELKKKYSSFVHWNREVIDQIQFTDTESKNIFLPLREITFRGQERTILDNLLAELLLKGFSEEQAGYIGWIIGELSDNSLTHAKGPCYIMFSRYSTVDLSFLEIAVGDSGIGIYESLLSNEKYQNLNKKQAFLKAFQSKVSSWPDSFKRGKGLCDLLTIALGNNGYVRSDTNDLGLFFNFSSNQRVVEFNEPLTKVNGTRFSVIIFEKDFKGASREDIDSFLEQEIKKYE